MRRLQGGPSGIVHDQSSVISLHGMRLLETSTLLKRPQTCLKVSASRKTHLPSCLLNEPCVGYRQPPCFVGCRSFVLQKVSGTGCGRHPLAGLLLRPQVLRHAARAVYARRVCRHCPILCQGVWAWVGRGCLVGWCFWSTTSDFRQLLIRKFPRDQLLLGSQPESD